jgi:hypothetical protein
MQLCFTPLAWRLWMMVVPLVQSLGVLCNEFPRIVGNRWNPTLRGGSAAGRCSAGALCAGPSGQAYSIGRQTGPLLYSTFRVPPLPSSDRREETTYYDYFNIFWPRGPGGAYMNQFVPQLMLGNALANSTNYPDYNPKWIVLDTWHVGAQYFMGLCFSKDCDRNWIPKAATGDLFAVYEGELIETSFSLVPVEDRFEWHLAIGAQDDPSRRSVVVADRPFMGLLGNATQNWMEDQYERIYVGSCLENYGMKGPRDYPSSWEIEVNVQSSNIHDWSSWTMWHDKSCKWQPDSSIINVQGPDWQTAFWRCSYSEEASSRMIVEN